MPTQKFVHDQNVNVKEEITIHKETCYYLYFYEEFCKSYFSIKRDNDIKYLILSGVYIYLVLEILVSYIIKTLLKILSLPPEKTLLKRWYADIENQNLLLKLVFFFDVFYKGAKYEEFSKLKDTIRKMSYLRNKIVHGYEISEMSISSSKSVKKSKLACKLTIKEINNAYSLFWEFLDEFSNLIKTIQIEKDNKLLNWNFRRDFLEKGLTDSIKQSLKNIEYKVKNA